MNGDDSRPLVETFRGRISRSVHVSSADVYRAWASLHHGSVTDLIPLSEGSPVRGELFLYRGRDDLPHLEHYDKLLMEREVMGLSDFPACVVRFPLVYGPHDPQFREFPVLRRVMDGRDIFLVGGGCSWLCSRVFVRDAARAIVTILESPKAMGEMFNVAEIPTLTQAQWIHLVAEAAGRKVTVVQIPDEMLPPGLQTYATQDQHVVLSSEKIRRTLDWQEANPPHVNLRESVSWHLARWSGSGKGPDIRGENLKIDYQAENKALEKARNLGLAREIKVHD